MSAPSLNRQQILGSLLKLDRPLVVVLRDLAGVAWDSEEELVTLRPAHLIEILSRFKSGGLDAEDVENWANAIEGRDDIEFGDDDHGTLKEVLFNLANPELEGPLTAETAEGWVERLNAVRGQEGRRPDGAEP